VGAKYLYIIYFAEPASDAGAMNNAVSSATLVVQTFAADAAHQSFNFHFITATPAFVAKDASVLLQAQLLLRSRPQ
jgi:hypothetical protein